MLMFSVHGPLLYKVTFNASLMNFNDQDTDHSLRLLFGGFFQTSHATLDDIITSDFDEFLTYNTLPFGSLSLSFNLEGALL